MEQKHALANEIAKYEIYVTSVWVRISCYDSRFLSSIEEIISQKNTT